MAQMLEALSLKPPKCWLHLLCTGYPHVSRTTFVVWTFSLGGGGGAGTIPEINHAQ